MRQLMRHKNDLIYYCFHTTSKNKFKVSVIIQYLSSNKIQNVPIIIDDIFVSEEIAIYQAKEYAKEQINFALTCNG